MLVIGHRGTAGIAPENSIEAFQAGLAAGADILQIDVRLTKDKIPVVIHDFHILRTHHHISMISQLTFDELQARTKDNPVPSLEKVLDTFFGVTVLNIDLKGRHTGKVVTELLKSKYITKKKDWDSILLSSSRGNELSNARRASSHANLALLQSLNPYLFVAYHRKLRLTAVGFHRLYVDRFALEIAKKAKLFIYVYTVNRPQTALRLIQEGIDGIVTDDPGTLLTYLEKHTA